MAEIKSTLELAMEKTKKIGISEKEREGIKQKEILQKVNSLFHRYKEGHSPLNEILKEIERMEEKTGETVKEGLLSQWIDALSLNEDNERVLKGIESLKQRNIEDVKQQFHNLLSKYQKEKEKAKQEEKTHLAETLRKEGIDGSAVEPNIEASQTWEKESRELDHRYGVKLEELKEAMKRL